MKLKSVSIIIYAIAAIMVVITLFFKKDLPIVIEKEWGFFCGFVVLAMILTEYLKKKWGK